MHLEHVEPCSLPALRRRHEIGDDLVHVGPRHLPRHRAVREIRKRRSRNNRPAPLLQRLVDSFPHQLGPAFAAGMAELQAEFGLRLRVHEIDDALPRGFVRVVVDAGAAG